MFQFGLLQHTIQKFKVSNLLSISFFHNADYLMDSPCSTLLFCCICVEKAMELKAFVKDLLNFAKSRKKIWMQTHHKQGHWLLFFKQLPLCLLKFSVQIPVACSEEKKIRETGIKQNRPGHTICCGGRWHVITFFVQLDRLFSRAGELHLSCLGRAAPSHTLFGGLCVVQVQAVPRNIE